MQRTTRYILDWFWMTRAKHDRFFFTLGIQKRYEDESECKRKCVSALSAFDGWMRVCIFAVLLFRLRRANFICGTYSGVSSTVLSSLAAPTSVDNKAATTECRVFVYLYVCRTHQLRYFVNSFCHLFRLMRIFMTKLLSLVAKRFLPFAVAIVAVCTNWTTCNIYLFIPLSCLLPFIVKRTFSSKMKSSQERASTLSIEYIFYVLYFALSTNPSASPSLALFPSLSYSVQTHRQYAGIFRVPVSVVYNLVEIFLMQHLSMEAFYLHKLRRMNNKIYLPTTSTVCTQCMPTKKDCFIYRTQW